MKQKRKECKRCAEMSLLYARGMCRPCDKIENPDKHGATLKRSKPLGYMRTHKPEHSPPTKPRKPLKKQSKKGAKVSKMDREFFHKIWNTRLRCSEVSNTPLGNEYNPRFFSHVLTKQAFPRFRHLDKNIVLMTPDEHTEWEFSDRSTEEFKAKFGHVLSLHDELVSEYYA